MGDQQGNRVLKALYNTQGAFSQDLVQALHKCSQSLMNNKQGVGCSAICDFYQYVRKQSGCEEKLERSPLRRKEGSGKAQASSLLLHLGCREHDTRSNSLCETPRLGTGDTVISTMLHPAC